MKHNRLAVLISILMFTGVFTLLAQSNTGKQYSTKDIDWRVHATVDYLAGAKGANAFLNVSADTDGKIYVANYSNILIIDAKTGKTLNSMHDESNTIIQYDDVAPTKDGNFWIADSKSIVYLVDSTGKILSNVVFKTSPGINERRPIEVEVDVEGNLYVLYTSNALQIQVFTSKGEYVRSILTGTGNLMGISHFTVAPDGTLFVEGNGVGWIADDNGKPIIKEFAPDFMKQNNFIQYRGVVVDPDGNVYFSAGADMDKATSIFKLDKNGNLLAQYGKGQERKNWGNDFGTDELSFTVSLALDANGALIISDTNNVYSQLIKINMQD